MPTIRETNVTTGETVEREMTQEEIDAITPSPEAVEAEVQQVADIMTQSDERLMALALATVDLRMADITGMNTAQVRQAFRARVVHYLRQRRGL